MIDEAGVRAKFGVAPESIPDYLALVGDTADGFPGLPGWGAKSAAAVLARYEHLEAIPPTAADWDVDVRGAAKLAATLGHRRDAAELFLDLATLRTDRRRRCRRRLGVARPGARARGVGQAARVGHARRPRRRLGPRTEELAVEDTRPDGGRLHVHRARDGPGDGELVLLLHGFPETSYEWRKQMPVLAAAGYRAVAPDQRGYAAGARPENVDAYTIDEWLADAVGFADALGVDRFHLVGHDWGGPSRWYVAGGVRRPPPHPHGRVHAAPDAVLELDRGGRAARSRRTCSCSAIRAPRRCSSTTTR